MPLEPKMLPPEEWEPFFRDTDQYDIAAVARMTVDIAGDLVESTTVAGAVNVLVNALSAVVANSTGSRAQVIAKILDHLQYALDANEKATFT